MSQWCDGIASDLEDSPVQHVPDICIVCGAKGDAWTRNWSGHEVWQRLCQCADCRAIVALVEEETIDKP